MLLHYILTITASKLLFFSLFKSCSMHASLDWMPGSHKSKSPPTFSSDRSILFHHRNTFACSSVQSHTYYFNSSASPFSPGQEDKLPTVAPFQKQHSAQRIVTEQKHKEQAHKNSSLWPFDLLLLGLAYPVSKSSTKGELSRPAE